MRENVVVYSLIIACLTGLGSQHHTGDTGMSGSLSQAWQASKRGPRETEARWTRWT